MKFSSLTVITAALLVITTQSFAQNFRGGINFTYGVPKGQFGSLVDSKGFGLSGDIGYLVPGSPLTVGLALGYLQYGSEERRTSFSTTVPDVTVNVSTTNSIALAHLLLRLQPDAGTVRPYADGLVGLHYLFTTTTVKNRGGFDEEIASSNNLGDVAFSYGGGGGLMVQVYDAPEQDGSGIKQVLVDVGARYLVGGEAEYLKEGSIKRENGTARYSALRSKTDLMTFHLGVSVVF